jgi:outer membrane protein TolC
MSDQAVRIVSHCVWFFLIALSFTAGCVVGPNFERPVGPAVTSYDAAPVSLPALGGPDPVQRFIDDGAIARQWWELFRSPALNEVLVLAIKGSPTLASARATLAQAEEVVVAARTTLRSIWPLRAITSTTAR